MHDPQAYQNNAETPEITRLIVLIGSHLTGRLQRMPEHFRCSVVQCKARRRQAAIGRLHPREAKIDQSNFSVVGLACIQQVLHDTQFTVNTASDVIVILLR